MVQIIQENRKPSFGERVTGGMNQAVNALSQYKNMAAENQAINKNIGLDLSGIQDAQTRQQLIADQLKYGRQFRQSQQVPGALQEASNSLGNQQQNPNQSAQDLLGGSPEQTQSSVRQEPIIDIEEPVKARPSNQVRSKNQPADSVESMAKQYVAELRPDLLNPSTQFGAIASFDAPNKSDLRPNEEADIRSKLSNQRVAPEVQDQVINNIRQDIQNRYNEAMNKYGFDKDRVQQIQNKWADFQRKAPENLAPLIQDYEGMPQTQDWLKNRYNQYAESLSSTLTPEAMHTQAKAMLDKDLNLLNSAHAIAAMPPIRSSSDASEYLNPVKNVYKEMVANGMMELAKEDAFLNKDMGNEEFHSAVWGDQTSKESLNKLHTLKAPQEYDSLNHFYNKSYPKERQNYVDGIAKSLKSINPTDDLILLRAMVLNQGGTVKDFTDGLDKAQKDGLKLSQFQNNQKGELEIQRRPPLWEIFSSPESTGLGATGIVGGMLNWKPFINYLRGKK